MKEPALSNRPADVWGDPIQLARQLENLVRSMYSCHILYGEAVRELRKHFILVALEKNKGNRTKAARELGLHRNSLLRAMRELDIPRRRVGRPTADREAALSGRSILGVRSNRQKPKGAQHER